MNEFNDKLKSIIQNENRLKILYDFKLKLLFYFHYL
jgi:hypothetical protein